MGLWSEGEGMARRACAELIQIEKGKGKGEHAATEQLKDAVQS